MPYITLVNLAKHYQIMASHLFTWALALSSVLVIMLSMLDSSEANGHHHCNHGHAQEYAPQYGHDDYGGQAATAYGHQDGHGGGHYAGQHPGYYAGHGGGHGAHGYHQGGGAAGYAGGGGGAKKTGDDNDEDDKDDKEYGQDDQDDKDDDQDDKE